MAQPLDKVAPGDLITASLMNAITDALAALETRVAALESAGPSQGAVVITGLLPSAGPYRIGQELRVFGQNFGFLVGSARVLLDSVLVTALKTGSNDQTLIFNIPDVPGVSLAGKTVSLTVSNQQQSDQRSIVLLPAQPLLGAVDITWLNVTPTTLTPNNPATFRFRLKSRTNLDATYTINPVISVAANSPLWQSRLEVLDNLQNLISNRTIQLNASQEKTFHVRISAVPSGTDGVNFSLSVTAGADGVTGGSGPVVATVGQPISQPDPNVSLGFDAVDFDPAGSGSLVQGTTEDTIQLSQGGAAKITFVAEFTSPGTYEPSVVLLPSSSNWNATVFSQSTPASYTITEASLNNPQNKHVETPEFIINPGAGASATGEVEFRIRRPAANTSQTRRMKLELD